MTKLITFTKQKPVRASTDNPRQLRPTSNLAANAAFAIPKRQRFQGALFFYNNKFKGGIKDPEVVWSSLITQVMFPEVKQKAITPSIKGKFRELFKLFAKSWQEIGASAFVSIKKDSENNTFRVTVPMIAVESSMSWPGTSRAAWLATGDATMSEDKENFNKMIEKATQSSQEVHRFELKDLQPSGNVSSLFAQFAKLTHAVLIVRPLGIHTVALLELSFSKEECEYLCNTEWLTIRPIDMYGLVTAWVNGYFGRRSRSPISTIPLSDIAKNSDATQSVPRLSKEGVLINEDGEIYAMPEKLNNIHGYEDKTNDAMSHPDGSFSAVSPEGTHIKPPAAMPVYMDWVNLKFAYTSLDGKLLVMNLDRSQPLNVTHSRKFLETTLELDLAQNFLSVSLNLAKFAGIMQEESQVFLKSLVKEIEQIGMRRESYQSAAEIPLVCVYEYGHAGKDGEGNPDEAGPICQKYVAYMNATRKFVTDNPTNAYARYSVPTVCNSLGQMTIFLDHGSRYSEVMTEDNTKRSAYNNQAVDPNYTLPAVPLVVEERGLMPHQTKVQNLLKDRPDNAVLPVDAGGGKTSAAVYEILREISEDDGKQGLCLVLCPSHLVAQYVKEFAFFTGSRVNVIPVTSYTIRRQGIERLQAMIVNAPPNTVVVSDYNAILLGKSSIAYGSSVVHTFPIIEFLRKFHFKYVVCDESHFLKNGSNRNAAVARLIIDIKKKRLMSGTMVADTITDLVRQSALMDPTIFGTANDFIKKYALSVSGSKVTAWQPGAELAIKRQLGRHVVIAEARRKEWAAILPHPIIRFHSADLTPNQQKAYHEVLNSVIEAIEAKAKENQALADLLSGKTDPEESEINLDSLLKPYLSRLEAFIVAPGKDPYGATMLSGEDLISPKVHAINKICKAHVDGNLNGKILIFTNYHSSTDAIFEGLAMVGLQDQTIYYTAAAKEECGAEFEKNPKKKILVGVEQSLNTGLNLQNASRLVRVSTVWTPGVVEQGDSRVNRPNVKVRETRQDIYYDTIVANNTIDVTKVAYLMSKTISKAKFDEAGNTRFDDLEVPPMLRMTLDSIRSENDFNGTLRDYFGKFEAYQQALHAEFQEYREKNKDLLFDSTGALKMSKLTRAPNPAGVALMRRVPYVPGTELYKASDLGLLRYDDFLAKHRVEALDTEDEEPVSDDGEDGEDDDEKEISEKDLSADKLAVLNRERQLCTGLSVHTDFGDGEIVRVNGKALRVLLPSGEYIRVRKLSAFIITRANTSNLDIRNQLLKLTGDVPVDKPIDVLEIKIDPAIEEAANEKLEKDKKKTSKDNSISMTLSFTIANDFLGISMDNLDDERAVKVAQGAGFKFTPAYFAAEVKQPQQLLNFFRALKDHGFSVDQAGNDACAEAYLHFKKNKSQADKFFGFSTSIGIKNFFRKEFKPKADKNYVMPYPLIQDGKLYICLPKQGHPGSLAAIRKTSNLLLKWLSYDAGSELIHFVGSKPEASSVIQGLLKLGIVLPNIASLKEEFKALRMVKKTASKDE